MEKLRLTSSKLSYAQRYSMHVTKRNGGSGDEIEKSISAARYFCARVLYGGNIPVT